ncbi:MAG: hypothetical protein KDC10_06730 [Calditrichaeota bacterium]|nr:hypothetical protein [Candidatus Cloacimonadota bacterium]MCA9787023.1 hypothetical protein [Candidatus Cloacimonadota bacterium]MCB1046881.1 hypothetical protein [Calditrichota bacterium]MCB9472713.1 hypothetical protein [Candidatus Delongbacteria bacterium]
MSRSWNVGLGLLVLATLCRAAEAPAPRAEPSSEESAMADMAPMPVMPLGELLHPEDSLSVMRYFADGKITLNDRCAVRQVRLNRKMGASYVNDHPVGFC